MSGPDPSKLSSWGQAVIIIAIVAAAVLLEAAGSANTLAIIALLGGLIWNSQRKTANTAASTAQDVGEIKHALNGEFQPRVAAAVQPQFDEINQHLVRLDRRLMAGDESFDALRAQIAGMSARLDGLTSCEVKPPESMP